MRTGSVKPRSARPRTTRRTPVRAPRLIAIPTLGDHEIAGGFAGAFKTSPATALGFAGGVLTATSPLTSRAARARHMVQWASLSGTAAQRQVLAKAYRQSSLELVLVQQMSELPRAQAAAFMKDYLAAGGSLQAVADWLSVAGQVLRQRAPGGLPARSRARARAIAPVRPLRGIFGDAWNWVKDTASKVGDAIGDAIGSIVDAVVSAGKSLADAIGAAVNWTVDQLTDLVEALIGAGKRVADILSAAAAKGLTVLKKFVQAVVAAGRSIGDILGWAAGRVASTLHAVVETLLALGKSIAQILAAAAGAGAAVVNAAVRALLALGRSVTAILAQIAGLASNIVRLVVNALLLAGQLLRSILAAAAGLATAACRAIVQALLALGRSLADILAQAVAAAGTVVRTILSTLLALGRTLGEILVTVASLAASAARAVVGALLALGRSVASLVLEVSSRAVAVARVLFQALLALGRKVAEILVAIAGRAASAIRTVLEALLAMGISLGTVVVTVVQSVAEGFRRGFFEGLVALGKGLLEILRAVAETAVSLLPLAFAVVIEMCGGHRPLSDAERAEAARIFGSSIDLGRVKIAVASLPADIINYINGDRPFTTMYIINFGSRAVIDLPTLIHELAHVWQGVQSGPLYMTRALEAQISAGVKSLFHTGKYDDSEAYRVEVADLVAAKGNFAAFNPEQQATIVERYWMYRFGGYSGDPAPYEPYALQVRSPRRAAARPAVRARRPVRRLAPRRA